ncbi:MAG TPA: helix-turn-helix transcriptional regulator, partial [Candidatus Nanopelagicales bacterium]|nr:helix-turn-helix transcriptional regulator [Candidatus Nanopelagicales bacterium]
MKRLPDATLKAIGAEIRRRREAADMSMSDLAERAELNGQYISRLELGQVDFSVSVLFSIAEALGCSVSDLLPGEGGELAPDVIATAKLLSVMDPEIRNAM